MQVIEIKWRPVRESNPCRRREREATYGNSRELGGMGSTLPHSEDSRELLLDVYWTREMLCRSVARTVWTNGF